MPNTQYLERIAYDRLVEALMSAPRVNPYTGEPDADAIKIALGEFGDIWPETIREDAEAVRKQAA
ncbi:hypothetical protein GGE07_001529 [Sinorhizobium terangae]|uniref:Uncharacterized protein n=1 Tax=Sinorhizobium terangae TaxID=110322 RepID=A0A6N7LNG1_SINTE|nr:hypothetical protein [Sinorhizobium terangae]MBB4184900.1 hypothetical protein [Sinorhizobium terangae]MQX18415.1 hypothetical protein [Sinorhizobium terangae]